jgi:hypothetical protein
MVEQRDVSLHVAPCVGNGCLLDAPDELGDVLLGDRAHDLYSAVATRRDPRKIS